MSSIGIPELESSETKRRRSSRGVHSDASRPAAATTRRNLGGRWLHPVPIRRWMRRRGRPPAASQGRSTRASADAPSAPRRTGSAARSSAATSSSSCPRALGPTSTVDDGWVAVEVDPIPGEAAQFLGAGTGQHGDDDVGMHGRVAGGRAQLRPKPDRARGPSARRRIGVGDESEVDGDIRLTSVGGAQSRSASGAAPAPAPA
jgi:hypothetical protein